MMQLAISWLDVDAETKRRDIDFGIAHSPTIRHSEVGQSGIFSLSLAERS